MNIANVCNPVGSRHIQAHPETQVALDQLGKVPRPYLPTYAFDGEYIDEAHRELSMRPTEGVCITAPIPGWLQVADAMKLYELAYFSAGPILEVGTAFGLSASIMAQACINAGREVAITSIELDPNTAASARTNLKRHGLLNKVSVEVGDAEAVCDKLINQGRKFRTAFVDHSHAYGPMARVLKRLPLLIESGGLVLFHDFNDPRNTTEHLETDQGGSYGVYAAVMDTLPNLDFKFLGVYGCCGLFAREAS